MTHAIPLVLGKPGWKPANAWQAIAWMGFYICVVGPPSSLGLLCWVLNDDGEPVPASPQTWVLWDATHYRTLRNDLHHGVRVSTVFIGVGHLWETLVFGKHPLGGRQWRYRTRAAALAGHEKALRRVQEQPS